MKLTESERSRIRTFGYTDHTMSYSIRNSDIKVFKSLVEKGLVEITPDDTYSGISVARLTENGRLIYSTLRS